VKGTTSDQAVPRRPGLDGLRGLAVIAVIAFHEQLSAFPGGFLGVDVFFVLSGYLITDLLAAQWNRHGRLDLRGFWARRARRLLPALAVLLVVVTAATAVIEPAQLAALRSALIAAVTYSSNWWQALAHHSYFAQFGPPPPLQHLWSLAIEEQFYLLWPLLLIGILKTCQSGRIRAALAWLGAALSALAMVLVYVPGADPSRVYYGTDTRAPALFIGSALALTWPLRRMQAMSRDGARVPDAIGLAGIAVLAWAMGHFAGTDRVLYPAGLLIVALAAGGVVLAAASPGLVSWALGGSVLRWIGIRSYGIYLWHWPVIAFGTALAGPRASSAWLWPVETAVTFGLASASWRYIETPIMRNGLGVTVRHWIQLVAAASRRPAAGTRGRAVPVAVAAAAAITVVVACYGIARPPAPDTPSGLLRQVANGERVSSSSQATPSARSAPSPSSAPSAAGRASAQATPTPAACHRGQPRVSGGQVTAVGDSVMLASAAALEAALPGVYIDAKIDRQTPAGLAVIRSLAAAGRLRHIVVFSLGTNGSVSASQLRQLQRAVGPGRELVLVSTFGPQAWEHAVNTALAAAARRGQHTELASWHQAIAARPALLWPDGIHPRPAGARLYARVVVAAIKAGLASQQPSCSPRL